MSLIKAPFISKVLLFFWIIILLCTAFLQREKNAELHSIGFSFSQDGLSSNHSDIKSLPSENPYSKSYQVSKIRDANSVHAATAARLDDNHIEAMWFGGSREGAGDVSIFANRYSIVDRKWGEPRIVLTREMVMAKTNTYVRKLGNPVLFRGSDSKLHLFFVGTSFGGWGASRIYHFESLDGEEYQFKQILPLSPILNISHLVRAVPVNLEDGGFYLPIYHEMAKKFSVILRFDKTGNFISRILPNELKGVLQPSLAATAQEKCILTMRNYPKPYKRLWLQSCSQSANKWQDPIQTNIENHNSSLNVAWFREKVLLIHNQKKGENSRYYLMLSKYSLGDNKVNRTVLLDEASIEGEVSYPTTLIVGNEIHIFYTYDRSYIKHLILNDAWMEKNDI